MNTIMTTTPNIALSSSRRGEFRFPTSEMMAQVERIAPAVVAPKNDAPLVVTTQAEHIVPQTDAPKQVVVLVAAKTETKADKARAIFNQSYADLTKVPQRKDIINRMVAEAGLTPAGAATYLQNFKTKAGLVAKK